MIEWITTRCAGTHGQHSLQRISHALPWKRQTVASESQSKGRGVNQVHEKLELPNHANRATMRHEARKEQLSRIGKQGMQASCLCNCHSCATFPQRKAALHASWIITYAGCVLACSLGGDAPPARS